MPSRSATLVIVLFWLATTGWYLARDVLPYYASDAPPPYVIDLADEALRQKVPVRWAFSRNGVFLGTLKTSIEYREADKSADESFQFDCNMKGDIHIAKIGEYDVALTDFHDAYRVTRTGELLGTDSDVSFSVSGMLCRLQIRSEIRNGEAALNCRISYPGGVIKPELDPMPVSRAGVLNAMHPVHRILGVKPGMRWRAPMVDSITQVQHFVFEQLLRKIGLNLPSAARVLTAEVTGPHEFRWRDRSVLCHIIEYRGDEYTARSWIRTTDGAVLRQTASANDVEFALERE
ncbi:MAG: hypothetical protein ACJ8C4_13230 [Gemmataceae bacterium]